MKRHRRTRDTLFTFLHLLHQRAPKSRCNTVQGFRYEENVENELLLSRAKSSMAYLVPFHILKNIYIFYWCHYNDVKREFTVNIEERCKHERARSRHLFSQSSSTFFLFYSPSRP